MHFHDHPSPNAHAALRHLQAKPFWLDDDQRPEPTAPLADPVECDLLVVGGGFTGLWTAVQAVQRHPEWSVVLVEGGRIAQGGSGLNGGFLSPSLTHGFANGLARWPKELPTLLRLGLANLEEIEKFVADQGIDCDLWRSGDLTVAVAEHQVAEVRSTGMQAQAFDTSVELLDGDQVRQRVTSPTYLGALFDPNVALVNPARLAWGLQAAAQRMGVRIHEYSSVRALNDQGDVVVADVARAQRDSAADHMTVPVRARRVALATNAFPPLLRRICAYVVPVWDYVIVTEPLTAQQWESLHWQGREGISDAGNQFHYYRPTADGRILWGGYDAIYHRGNGFGPQYAANAQAFARLAEHFLQTFPQLTGVQFTHGWGGAIDTCSRFSPFWGLAHRGKTGYVAGYTGLGVGSSRFGAATMLDLLEGLRTERTALRMVRTRPIPFPGEPLRSLGISWTVAALRAADRNAGRRNLWLRTLDRCGMGFDS